MQSAVRGELGPNKGVIIVLFVAFQYECAYWFFGAFAIDDTICNRFHRIGIDL
jgi:hypothetical protein